MYYIVDKIITAVEEPTHKYISTDNLKMALFLIFRQTFLKV
jgi:hypothetical protein